MSTMHLNQSETTILRSWKKSQRFSIKIRDKFNIQKYYRSIMQEFLCLLSILDNLTISKEWILLQIINSGSRTVKHFSYFREIRPFKISVFLRKNGRNQIHLSIDGNSVAMLSSWWHSTISWKIILLHFCPITVQLDICINARLKFQFSIIFNNCTCFYTITRKVDNFSLKMTLFAWLMDALAIATSETSKDW